MRNFTVALDDKETIHGHRPINRQSARVISKNHEITPYFEPSSGLIRSNSRLPTVQFVGRPQDNLIGIKYGTLTVIGVFIKQNKKKNLSWVVRCACGYYETRKARAIKNKNNSDDCCHGCQHVKRLGRRFITETK